MTPVIIIAIATAIVGASIATIFYIYRQDKTDECYLQDANKEMADFVKSYTEILIRQVDKIEADFIRRLKAGASQISVAENRQQHTENGGQTCDNGNDKTP